MFTDLFAESGGRSGLIPRAMEAIAAAGAGILIVIRDARPEAISEQMKAKGQGEPFTVRDYGVGAQILVDLGVTDMELLTTSHRAYVGLEGYGLKVIGERQLSDHS
jgi:3,4-dihydroxy 2-butanone 4-phosphate synthase/GTP cyclohydrolase II